MPDISGYSVAEMADHLATPYDNSVSTNYPTVPQPTNIAKYLQAWRDGFWQQIEADLTTAQANSYVATASGIALDLHGYATRTTRREGESDEAYRIRIIGARKRLYGGVTVDDIIETVATIIDADTGSQNIEVVENIRADGTFEPAYFRVIFSTTFLAAQGFAPSEYADVFQEIQDTLKDIAAAGVRVEVTLAGGATWDSSLWDDPDSVFGS